MSQTHFGCTLPYNKNAHGWRTARAQLSASRLPRHTTLHPTPNTLSILRRATILLVWRASSAVGSLALAFTTKTPLLPSVSSTTRTSRIRHGKNIYSFYMVQNEKHFGRARIFLHSSATPLPSMGTCGGFGAQLRTLSLNTTPII